MAVTHWASLQWGHDQLIVEIARTQPILASIDLASMGPRSADRGNFAAVRRHAAAGAWLQWGHDQLIVEIADLLSYSVFNDLRNRFRAALILFYSSREKLVCRPS